VTGQQATPRTPLTFEPATGKKRFAAACQAGGAQKGDGVGHTSFSDEGLRNIVPASVAASGKRQMAHDSAVIGVHGCG
jgi:hypothetical protein